MYIDKDILLYFLLVLILMGFMSFSEPIVAEEIKPAIIGSGVTSGRRFLPERKKDKDKGNKNSNSSNGSSEGNVDENDSDIIKVDAKLKLGVVLMWDYDQFNGIHLGTRDNDYRISNETELRRARIDIESKINNDWRAEFELSFDDGDKAMQVGDAFIAFTGWDYFDFSIGQTKEPFGLEELTSSKNITFIEPSMATCVFAPGYHPGLSLSGHQRQFTWNMGIYEESDRENKKDTYALTGRFVFTPLEQKNRILHFGISGSLRDFDGEKYEIEERAEVHTAEKIVRSVETSADEVRLLGIELAWVYGPFSMQTEHMTAIIKEVLGNDTSYSGYYLQVSYFLTGESRSYKEGRFSQIKPFTRIGAIELVSRYSFMDTEDNNRGVRVSNFTLGGNYYLNKWVRLMIDYIKTNLTDAVSNMEGRAEAISIRIQYSF